MQGYDYILALKTSGCCSASASCRDRRVEGATPKVVGRERSCRKRKTLGVSEHEGGSNYSGKGQCTSSEKENKASCKVQKSLDQQRPQLNAAGARDRTDLLQR